MLSKKIAKKANKYENRLKKIEKELIELSHKIQMQTERAIDAFWDDMATNAEDCYVDEGEKWR